MISLVLSCSGSGRFCYYALDKDLYKIKFYLPFFFQDWSNMFSLHVIDNMYSRVFHLMCSLYDLIITDELQAFLLYPRHLCRGVYSFRLSVRPFVCSYVRSFVCSFVLPSVAWNLRQSFALKFLKWCISQQLLIRKHSYLDHSYPGGLAFTP